MKVICKKCGKEFEKQNSEAKRGTNHFCSRSCANSYNNSKVPKRKCKVYRCKVCGIRVSQRRLYCDDHSPNIVDWSKVTLESMQILRAYQKNSRIRELARKKYIRLGKPQCCAICGYTKTFQVCHIKAISSFSQGSTIAEINHEKNLIALCPNHHWELDHGLLDPAAGLEPASSNYG